MNRRENRPLAFRRAVSLLRGSENDTIRGLALKLLVVLQNYCKTNPGLEGYIRICYASKYEQLAEALERMEKAFAVKG